MKKVPDALFVIDPKKEEIAIAEARKLNIPIIATETRTAIPILSITPFRQTMMLSVPLNC